jgi:hypothetical protein
MKACRLECYEKSHVNLRASTTEINPGIRKNRNDLREENSYLIGFGAITEIRHIHANQV